MIHLVIAESKKGYDWFEKSNVKINFVGGEFDKFEFDSFIVLNDKDESCLFFPENLYIRDKHDILLESWPRTEKELNSMLQKEFQTILNLSKDKILYIFTTSQQVFNFFRIQIIKKEIKCEDLKISFIEEFYTDENDFNKIDLVVYQNGMIDHWPQRMFAKMASDCVEILRGGRLSRKASNVPQAVTEKSPGTS